jgi:hypothetical protein
MAALLFSLPLIFLLAAGGSHLPFSCETLAFRYFGSVRVLDGAGGGVWPAQGHLLMLFQNLILAALRIFSGDDFKTSLRLFGILTNLTVGVAMFLLYATTCLDRRLLWSDKALVLVLGPATILGTVHAGFYYSLLPDYYAFDLLLISVSVYAALCYWRNPHAFTFRDAVVPGLLAGVAMANKITLLGPAGVVVLLAISRSPISFRQFIQRTLIAGLACLGTYALVFWAAYKFNWGDAFAGASHSLDFLQDAGEETGFWEGNFQTFLHSYNYEKIFYIWAAATLLVLVEFVRVRQWRAGIVLFANLLVATLLALGLQKRGAGTTFFEVSSILAGLAILMLAIGLGLGRWGRWTLTVPAIILIAAAQQFDFRHNWFVVSKSRDLARIAWEVHEQALAFHQPVVVVIPDPSYYTGSSIEELLQTGLFTALYGAPGDKITAHYLANIEFRPEPGAIPEGTTVVWLEKWDQAANKPLRETDVAEGRRWASLVQLAAINDGHTWRTGYSDLSLVSVCSVKRLK